MSIELSYTEGSINISVIFPSDTDGDDDVIGDVCDPNVEVSYSLSGYEWTKRGRSVPACIAYCESLGYSSGLVVGTGRQILCAGAQCRYIRDFETCARALGGNTGRCQCNTQHTCKCIR